MSKQTDKQKFDDIIYFYLDTWVVIRRHGRGTAEYSAHVSAIKKNYKGAGLAEFLAQTASLIAMSQHLELFCIFGKYICRLFP